MNYFNMIMNSLVTTVVKTKWGKCEGKLMKIVSEGISAFRKKIDDFKIIHNYA